MIFMRQLLHMPALRDLTGFALSKPASWMVFRIVVSVMTEA